MDHHAFSCGMSDDAERPVRDVAARVRDRGRRQRCSLARRSGIRHAELERKEAPGLVLTEQRFGESSLLALGVGRFHVVGKIATEEDEERPRIHEQACRRRR